MAARRWAQQAVALDRDAAEGWMILARVSGARARNAYLKQAVSTQPGNAKVVEVLRQSKKSQPNRILIMFFSLAVLLVGALCFVSQADVSQVKALFYPLPKIRAVQEAGHGSAGTASAPSVADIPDGPSPTASSSPTATYTPFPAYTDTPTSTPTPLPTSTFTPSPTATATATPTETPSPLPSPTETPAAAEPPPAYASSGGKSIVVSISEQHVYAYQGDRLVFSFPASTGQGGSTLPGNFSILDKIPDAYSNPWGFWMPYWMGVYYVGYDLENGFHSLPVLYNGQEIWGDSIGVPITYGCIVLQPGDMKQLYTWADVGTPVQIVP